MATPKVVGHIEYSKTVCDNGRIEIQVIWTIPAFKNEIKPQDCTYSELQSPKFDKTTNAECQFQLKIEKMIRLTDSKLDAYHIYYMSQAEIRLTSIELIMFQKPLHRSQAEPINYLTNGVEANKWEFFDILRGLSKCLFKDDILHFQFKFDILSEKERKEFLFIILANQLISDLKNLFLEGFHSDIVIKSADDEKFKVHKGVLASRCAVLKAHFEHNTTNIVESPLESAVLREVLLFIYTDETSKLEEIPEKLLAAADYYQLHRLKSLCEEALYKKLTVDNAVETLQLADLHSANTLKRLSLDFIKEDYKQLKLITKTEGWAKLQSIDLLKKICE